MNQDRLIKKIEFYVKDKIDPKSNEQLYKSIFVSERDILDLIYRKDDKNVKIYGECIKIGIENNEKYLVVLDYNYREENIVHQIYIKDISKINNINRQDIPISFAPVFCPDESIILLKQNENGELCFSSNGRVYKTASSSGEQKDVIGILYDTLTEHGLKCTKMEMFDRLVDLLNNIDSIVCRTYDDSIPIIEGPDE